MSSHLLKLKPHFSRFLKHHQDKLYFTSHSHHFWPDVSFKGHMKYWDLSSQYVDDKWELILGEEFNLFKKFTALNLNVSKPQNITLAPNSHELVFRLFSHFSDFSKIRVLSSDSEFYSFQRQILRLKEEGLILDQIPTQDFASFKDRFLEQIKKHDYDVIYISQVFFNSGFCIQDLKSLVDATSEKTLFIVDGYHAYMALPVDIKSIEERVFYISGGYKYAMGGEGACFLYSPRTDLRPVNTGWFAHFGEWNFDSNITYQNDGSHYAGSTFDGTALFRQNAVYKWLEEQSITPMISHQHVKALQKMFLQELAHTEYNHENLVHQNINEIGNFLCFDFKSPKKAKKLYTDLKSKNIVTDYRGSRLRFGFGLAHDESDILNLSQILKA